MSFPRYPRYKESGVEGLGDIPGEWNVSRLGYVSWVRARLGWKGLKADEYVQEGFVFLSTPNIKGREIDFEDVNYITEERYEESPEIKLRVGDVLLTKDGSTLGTVNVVRSLPRPATVNSSLAVITSGSKLNSVFLYYLFQSVYMIDTVQRIKGGMGVPHLFQQDLNKFFLALPPHTEQAAIAQFLDREVTKIDSLVAEQQRLIELLSEKRQAAISHTVTKGLNPKVAMLPSGVRSLGEVPAHWDATTVRRIAHSVATGRTPAVQSPGDEVENGIEWYTPVDFGSSLCLDIAERKVAPACIESGEALNLCPGSVLIVAIGATLGKVGFIGRPASANQQINAVTPRDGIDTEFLAFSLSAKAEVMRSLSNSSTIGIMNQEKTKEIPLAIPPLDEQLAIVAFLRGQTAVLDALTTEAERAIALLQERRTALISAAVTGKIDVRGLPT